MTIFVKNKYTLQVEEFFFRCCIGKKGFAKKKIEGDKKTPKGTYEIGDLYYRKDKIKKPITKLKCIAITSKMGWSNDSNYPKKYNKLIDINYSISHEKLKRKDSKYDLLIPIRYNYIKTIPERGSCIFIHLTKKYRPTAGCISLKKKDFLIMLKLINKKTKIKIY